MWRPIMVIKSTMLRQNLYGYLDGVLETGKPLVIERKGRRLKIVPESSPAKTDCLEHHDAIVGDPDDLLGLDWSSEWKGELP
jgi:hypothetical protein